MVVVSVKTGLTGTTGTVGDAVEVIGTTGGNPIVVLNEFVNAFKADVVFILLISILSGIGGYVPLAYCDDVS